MSFDHNLKLVSFRIMFDVNAELSVDGVIEVSGFVELISIVFLLCDLGSVKSGMFGLFVVFRFDFGARVLWETIC